MEAKPLNPYLFLLVTLISSCFNSVAEAKEDSSCFNPENEASPLKILLLFELKAFLNIDIYISVRFESEYRPMHNSKFDRWNGGRDEGKTRRGRAGNERKLRECARLVTNRRLFMRDHVDLRIFNVILRLFCLQMHFEESLSCGKNSET